jgi:rhodanese-related sulfurtransferase
MKQVIIIVLVFASGISFAQKKLSKLLNKENSGSIPYIYAEELASSNPILLDAREQKEYNTSHIKNAIFVGYDFFKLDSLTPQIPNKSSEIVVYCSLGIRSEDIAEKLKKAGFENVKNLYGGIFEWKNSNLPVYNSNEKETDSIHTFSKAWSKWLTKGIKVYE